MSENEAAFTSAPARPVHASLTVSEPPGARRPDDGCPDRRAGGSPPARLSGREREVLALLAEGASNLEIAVSLFISVNTVERHVANICVKLGARGRTAAVARAIRAALI